MTFRLEASRVLAFLAVAALCSCSGGGSVAPNVARTAVPVSTGAPVTSSPGASVPDASARFTITVPKAASAASVRDGRSPKYVSSSTQSVVITLVSVDGTAYTGTPSEIASNLTTANSACSGSPLTCTVAAPAVGGTDVFSIATYDAQQTSASPQTPAGNVLSTATTTVAVTAGQANAVTTAIVLGGVVSSVDVALSPGTVTEGTPVSSIAVAVNVRDADRNIIVGSYVDANGNPLTVDLSDSDGTGATTLSQTSVSSSSNAVTLSYTGANIASPSIAPTVTGGTVAGAKTAATLTVAKPAAPTLTQLGQNVWVTQSSQTSFAQTLTGTNFTAVGTSVAVSDPGITVSNVTVQSATSISATFTVKAGEAVGPYGVTVTTPGGSTAAVPLSIEQGTIVTSNADSMPGTPAGTGPGVAGDLRYALQNTPAGDAIVFQCGSSATSACTIVLAGPLPPIESAIVLDGGGAAQTTIDGASAYRAFFVDTGTVTLEDLTVANVLAHGGNGGYGAGGGLGAGAGIFVNQPGANVTVRNVAFSNAVATGGTGGDGTANGNNGGGGGGGLDAPGGGDPSGGSGGGGVLSPGGGGNSGIVFSGGGGGGGLGGAQGMESTGGTYGTPYGSNAHGSTGSKLTFGSDSQVSGGAGGTGGFGGGGAGGGIGGAGANPQTDVETGGNGGAGGFGGGGGGGGAVGGAVNNSSMGGSGGAGGPGGGGGSGGFNAFSLTYGTAGSGGALGPLGGGNSDGPYGGGGAAAGPAIFVNDGTLTTANVTVSSFTLTPGPGVSGNVFGITYSSQTGTAGSAATFNYAGTVNGSTTVGDVASAVTQASMGRTGSETRAGRRPAIR